MTTLKKATALLIILCSIYIQLHAQTSFNNFETSHKLDIMIDSLSADTIWQIGVPQKTVLNETSSQPNALITDTLNTYPANTNASFIVELDEHAIGAFPYIQLEWFQYTDFEEGVDGGIIDVSYDGGETWKNIFTDTLYRPEVVGSYQWDTLHNQEAGITGTNGQQWMAICWGTAFGAHPTYLETIHVRFTMSSDSIDTGQDGWLLDDFNVFIGVVGSTANRQAFKDMSIYPNPANQNLQIDLNEVIDEEVDVYIYDNTGRMIFSEKAAMYGEAVHNINVSQFVAGIYHIIVQGEEVLYRQKFVKIN